MANEIPGVVDLQDLPPEDARAYLEASGLHRDPREEQRFAAAQRRREREALLAAEPAQEVQVQEGPNSAD